MRPGHARTIYRFIVAAEDGRRSCDWRIWTGSRKPSDDVYLSPGKLGGELKVSLHRDGWCQHGLDASIRTQLRTGDRHALDRWRIADELAPGWRPGYRLRFPESQLEGGLEEVGDVARVTAPPVGTAVEVTVMIGAPNAVALVFEAIPGVRELARLDRKSGGVAVILSTVKAFDEEEIESAVELASSGHHWSLPHGLSEKRFGWGTTVFDDETRGCTEFYMARYVAEGPPAPLPPFTGEVRSWDDERVPVVARQRRDICGVLVCHRDKPAELFIDNRARCDHSSLGDTAEQLRVSYVYGVQDDAWMSMGNQSYATLLMTPRLYFESRDEGQLPDHRVRGLPGPDIGS